MKEVRRLGVDQHCWPFGLRVPQSSVLLEGISRESKTVLAKATALLQGYG